MAVFAFPAEKWCENGTRIHGIAASRKWSQSILTLLATFEMHTVRLSIISRASLDVSIADLMAILTLVTKAVRGRGGGDALCGILEARGERKTELEKSQLLRMP